MIYFSLEAYLNYLISLIAPEAYENEREFFSRRPYQGTLGKYIFLRRMLSMTTPNMGRRPHQTVKELQKLRDLAVHAKPERGERMVNVKKEHHPEEYIPRMGRAVTKGKADRALKDIKVIVNDLHAYARKHYPDTLQSDNPLGIIFSCSITDHH